VNGGVSGGGGEASGKASGEASTGASGEASGKASGKASVFAAPPESGASRLSGAVRTLQEAPPRRFQPTAAANDARRASDPRAAASARRDRSDSAARGVRDAAAIRRDLDRVRSIGERARKRERDLKEELRRTKRRGGRGGDSRRGQANAKRGDRR
jgi:hypothetical protein